jgi:hypothetical protein
MREGVERWEDMITPLPVQEFNFAGLRRPNQLLSGIFDIEYCLRLAQAVPAELLRYSMAVFFDCASVDFCY